MIQVLARLVVSSIIIDPDVYRSCVESCGSRILPCPGQDFHA